MTADSAIIAVGPPIIGRVRCADGTSEHRLNLARSRETDRRKAYENRSPVFSYERSPNYQLLNINFFQLSWRCSDGAVVCTAARGALGCNCMHSPVLNTGYIYADNLRSTSHTSRFTTVPVPFVLASLKFDNRLWTNKNNKEKNFPINFWLSLNIRNLDGLDSFVATAIWNVLHVLHRKVAHSLDYYCMFVAWNVCILCVSVYSYTVFFVNNNKPTISNAP